MRKRSVTCDAWDVVAVPFPFTDRLAQKRRPALIISPKNFNRYGHSLMAMITSSGQPWPGDSPLRDLNSAGLSSACVVRLKLFTLDNRLIIRQIGRLSANDRSKVAAALKLVLPF
ncbi:MAG: type II toxin-antitoxin system PemK/MazF family toxin [Gammaproteobacteria bacterium]